MALIIMRDRALVTDEDLDQAYAEMSEIEVQ